MIKCSLFRSIVLYTIFFINQIHAASCTPISGVRVWDYVIDTLVKVCTIESTVNVIDTRTSSIYNVDQTILSLVEDIDPRVISIQSAIDNSVNCCSAVNVIDTRTASIYDVDRTILSYVEDVDPRVNSIQSTVNVIDTRTGSIYNTDQTILSYVANAQNCCSAVNAIDTRTASIFSLDQSIAANVNSIQSTVNVIDTRTSSIYNVDQTILSLVEDIDPRVISIQSAIDNSVNCCSAVNVIDTRTSSIYNLDQTINSKIDALTVLDQTTASKVGVIDTRTSSIYNTDQTILSYVANAQNCCSAVNAIDTRTASIFSLDQSIAANVNSIQSTVNVIDTRTSSIYNLDQTINSKVDALTALDQTTASKVGVIDTRTTSIYNTDQTILSYVANAQNCCSAVNAIDTRTASIFSLDQVIVNNVNSVSSKIDVDIAIDRSTQSTVNVIDTRTSSIYNTDQTILSYVANAQNCCSAVNAIDTRTASIFSLEQVIASQISVVNNASAIAAVQTTVNNIYSLDQTIASNVNVILSSVGTSTNNQPFIGIFGSEIAEGRTDTINIQFQYGIPSYSTTTYTQGGGTVTSANSMAVLSTAGSANSIAQIQSIDNITYNCGHDAYAYFTAAFTGSFVATSSQLIGPYDYQNGFAVGFNGTTFGVLQRSNASNASVVVDTFVPQSSFNQDKLDGTGTSGFVYVPGNLNIFRISYGWLGSAIVKFQIMNSNGNWITFHIIQNPNGSNIPSIAQPLLPITARVENLAGTSVLTLQTASWNGGTVANQSNASYRYFQANNTIASPAAGTETHVLTLQNQTVFSNKPNKIKVRIAAFGGGPIDAVVEQAIMRLRKNATVTGTSFSQVSSGNSVMALSTAGTYSAGTGTLMFLKPSITTGNGPSIDLFPTGTYDIFVYPGETITITVTAASASQSVLGGVAWEERF